MRCQQLDDMINYTKMSLARVTPRGGEPRIIGEPRCRANPLEVGGSSPSKEKKLSRRAVERLQRFDRSQFVGLTDDGELCQPGFLDLFSGERGVAEELHRITGRWVLCFDITHSPKKDLSKRSLQREIEELVRHGALWRSSMLFL